MTDRTVSQRFNYTPLDPSKWVSAYGDVLYGYALVRLRDPQSAADVVQETFLAALSARESFAGRSSERSWLIGILKHKIIDLMRKHSKEHLAEDITKLTDDESSFFAEGGHWQANAAPKPWSSTPDEAAQNKEFWEVARRCLGCLPRNLADAFTLRELDGMDTKEICKVLGVSTTNLWVMLHRARILMRRCFETHWFVRSEK